MQEMLYLRIKIIIPALLIILVSSCRYFQKEDAVIQVPVQDTTAIPVREPELVFGIPVEAYELKTGHIKRNGFLSEILLENGVPMQEINQAISNSDSIFDVRKIRSGNHFTLFCDTDSIARARYLIYEHDPTLSYIFSFNDSLNITPFKKEINKVIRYSSGTIETSLWESMIAQGMQPELAGELSEIFAWTVDFFGLQKGDSYKVFYEELSIEGKPLGIGKIYGAQFVWTGDTITAIPFIQEGRETFFDVDGNSLRKAFLKAPLRFSRISSRYSSSRLHPILRIRRPHYGVDYAAPIGTPVQAIGDGRVTFAGTENGAGRIVKITHNSVYSTAYMHLSGFGKGITTGAHVKQGDIIGYVGSSGLSTGPHLDFRFYKNGSPVDPLSVEAPPVEPVSEENMARFEKNRMLVLNMLATF